MPEIGHIHQLFVDCGAVACADDDCNFYIEGDDLLDLVRDGLRTPRLEDEIRNQQHMIAEIDKVCDLAGAPEWKNVVHHGGNSGEWSGDSMTILERVKWLARQLPRREEKNG